MTFEEGCKLSYDIFKKEYGTGIGCIKKCSDFWVFGRKSETLEYDSLPIIVYKEDKQPEYLTFDMLLELADVLDKAEDLEVPEIYIN